jgi:hypothetical protein
MLTSGTRDFLTPPPTGIGGYCRGPHYQVGILVLTRKPYCHGSAFIGD